MSLKMEVAGSSRTCVKFYMSQNYVLFACFSILRYTVYALSMALTFITHCLKQLSISKRGVLWLQLFYCGCIMKHPRIIFFNGAALVHSNFWLSF
jgi:hypothetical protein